MGVVSGEHFSPSGRAGGTEISPPHDERGMPRTSAVVDPSNNLIHVYQNA
jgi:hypothetical protein